MQWFEEWFDTPYYHILYKNHDYQEAEDFLNLLTDYVKLEKNSKIIDLKSSLEYFKDKFDTLISFLHKKLHS